MTRLRVAIWEWLFQSAVRFSNFALVRRSKACGCVACEHVARLTLAFAQSQRMQMVKAPPAANVHGPN